jgi:tetratricopeptide (TPR) repeat protein
VELHPYLQVGRVFYAHALEFSARLDEALAQYQMAWLTSQDVSWMRALEGICLAKLGRTREAQAILAELDALRRSEYVDAYFMAVMRQALGQREPALAELERALDENSAWLYQLHMDAKMKAFHGDPRFERVREAVKPV